MNTETLLSSTAGGKPASDALMPLIYSELRALAGQYLARERPDHTLQPAELVNEAYLRMVDISRVDWRGRTHFFAVAARQMRRILIDHARGKKTQKRGSGGQRVTLDEELPVEHAKPENVIALEQALQSLAREHERAASVVELRLFGGLSAKDVAAELGVTERTVRNDWNFGRDHLSRELGLSTRK